MGLINAVKNIFKRKKREETKKDSKEMYKVEATPERIALKKKIDSTLQCCVCGRVSGFYRITLRKLEKGKYICDKCLEGGGK